MVSNHNLIRRTTWMVHITGLNFEIAKYECEAKHSLYFMKHRRERERERERESWAIVLHEVNDILYFMFIFCDSKVQIVNLHIKLCLNAKIYIFLAIIYYFLEFLNYYFLWSIIFWKTTIFKYSKKLINKFQIIEKNWSPTTFYYGYQLE